MEQPDRTVEDLFLVAQMAVSTAQQAIETAKTLWPLRNRDAWSLAMWNNADHEAQKAIWEANRAIGLHRSAAALRRAAGLN